MSTVVGRPAPPRTVAARRAGARTLVREQALVAAGQLGAGVGNLVFALLAARLLDPGAFAELAVFLALFLVVHVPLGALSAGSAVTPAFAAAQRRRAAGAGTLAALVLAALAVPLAGPLDVSPALLLVLAAGLPSAGWLALERGRLLGAGRHAAAVASLVAEPVLRLGLGLPLALATGAVGGAIGVVAGGWLALAVTRPGLPRRSPAAPAAEVTGIAGTATLGFLLLAVLQNADVVLANAVLGDGEAGRFAIVSTLGGVAAFATTTIPLVLLPRVRDTPAALHAALGAAALLGLGAVAAVLLAPGDWVAAAFGPDAADVAPLVAPYVAGMALLGIARVVVAERVARDRGRPLAIAMAVLAAGHVTAVLLLGTSAAAITAVTIVTMGLLVAACGVALLQPAPGTLAATAVLDAPAAPPPPVAAPAPAAALPRGEGEGDGVPWKALVGLTVAALLVRLAVTRGIWLDEAISIRQAQGSWDALFEGLRTTDVHPPLHHVTLWVLAHTIGTDEWVMRAPSLLAGTLLVPALYALGHVLWDRRAGLVAAALATVAPFLVWYAQEARMYAFFMLFAVLALLGQALVLRGGGVRAWALYVGATVLLLASHYFAFAFAGVQQAAFLVAIAVRLRTDRAAGLRLAGAWLAASAVVAVALLPVLGLALEQFRANEASGRGFDQGPSQAGDVAEVRPRPDVYSVLTNFAWAALGYHSDATLARLTSLWPLAMLGALVVLGRRPTWRMHLVLACAFVPAALLLAAGMAKPFLFEIRYFVATAPLLLLLLARGLTAWTRSRVVLAGTSALLVAVLAVATVDQLVNGANPRRYDFEGALAQVEERMRPGDVLVYEPSYLRDVVAYYQPDLRSAPLDQGLPDRRWAPRVFLLSSFQDLPAHARAVGTAKARLRQERRPAGRFSRPQVEVTVFR